MRDILALALVRAELCRASAALRPEPATARVRADNRFVSGRVVSGWRPFRRRGLKPETPPRAAAADGSTPPD